MKISGDSSLLQMTATQGAQDGDAIARARKLQSISGQANSERNDELERELDSFSVHASSPAGEGRGQLLDIKV